MKPVRFAFAKLKKIAASDKTRRVLSKERLFRAAGLVLRVTLLAGLSFIILYPFIIKLSAAFMPLEDTYDETVSLIPRHPTFRNIIYLFEYFPFLRSILNTLIFSLLTSVFSCVSCTAAGYGLGKFKFRGRKILLGFVLGSLLIPFSTIVIPSYMYFRYFDIAGVIKLIFGHSANTLSSFFPIAFLSAVCMGFRSGLYILIMMQCFSGLPVELDEAAQVDGANTWRLFWQINLPLAKTMLFVVFMLSFSWQWTDTTYSTLLCTDMDQFPRLLGLIASQNLSQAVYYRSLLANGAVLLMLTPLIVIYLFVQRQLIQGIERAGLVG